MSQIDALLGLGRLPEAERAARVAQLQDPENKGFTVRLAVVLLAEGRSDESGALIHRALRESHGHPVVFYEAARELLLIPDPNPLVREEALAMAQKAVQLSRGGQPWHLLTLAQALKANGQTEEAEKVLTVCLAQAKAKKMEGLTRQVERESARSVGGSVAGVTKGGPPSSQEEPDPHGPAKN